MSSIYTLASDVVAWLGTGNWDTDKAIQYIRNQPDTFRRAVATGNANEHLASFEESFERVAFSVREIFRAAYWSRLWILQELALAANPLIICGFEELPWKTFVDFATQVAAADFGSNTQLRHIKSDILERQATWLLTLIYKKRRRGLNLAELVFLSKDAVCEFDKKDHIRALLSMIETGNGRRGMFVPKYYSTACEIISEATRIIILDMRADESIKGDVKRICERLAENAHHHPMIVSREMDDRRAHCTHYVEPLQHCREIATCLYDNRVLMRSRVRSADESWDFGHKTVRRRRSRSGSGSRSQSSVDSRSRRRRSRNGWRRVCDVTTAVISDILKI